MIEIKLHFIAIIRRQTTFTQKLTREINRHSPYLDGQKSDSEHCNVFHGLLSLIIILQPTDSDELIMCDHKRCTGIYTLASSWLGGNNAYAHILFNLIAHNLE